MVDRAGQAQGAGAPAAAVLVVDDGAANRLAVATMLKPLGHPIVEADSGRAALRAVMHQNFAVILMDVRMPTLDGYETARLIRERRQSAHTPIIFLTAFGADEVEMTGAYASGAVDFIFAPIHPDIVRAKVSAFVSLFAKSEEQQRSLASIRRLNASLRDSEVRTRAVLQNVADGIVTVDEYGLIASFNPAARRLFGYAEEEVVGRPLQFILAPGGREAFSKADLASVGDVPAKPTETVASRKDGSCFPVEIGLSRMEIGEHTFTIGAIHDISDRTEQARQEQRRAQELRHGAELDRVAFEEAPIGGVITSRDGAIEQVNHAICEMLGHTAEELSGTQLAQFTHPEDRDESDAAVAAMLSGASRTRRFERRFIDSDGHIIEALVALTAIRDEAHDVAQLFAQIEDVTDARRTSRELEQAQFEILARLAAAAELHEDSTGRHTHRVGELAVSIAERLGLHHQEIALLRLAASLHDVGKIAIADTLLGKRGKLTSGEFEQMKTHTTVGSQMLADSPFALLNLAAESALTHHEKWDGSGYPAGLAGDAIPISGRIVAVADVFDTLTHTRPYKPAWTQTDAIAEMSKQAGRHFDPEVLEAFFAAPTPF